MAGLFHHVVAQLSPGIKKGKTLRKPLKSAWTAEYEEKFGQLHRGKLRPVAYAGRALTPAKKNMLNYTSMKL